MDKSTETVSTGERVTLGKSSKRNQEDHTARYEFAAPYAKGKKVLDIACGTGYGSKILKDAGAEEIVGVDIDQASINYAQENFSSENIKYLCDSAADVDLPKKHFDLIVSFETIEHLEESERSKYLNILKESLIDDGIIILSTPNKLITSPWSKKPLNPYHVLEYYRGDLKKELDEHGLKIVEWYGQRFVAVLFTKRLVYLAVRVLEKGLRRSFGIYDIADGASVKELRKRVEPRYFIVKVNK